MPTYAIGDVHGCLKKLKELLALIHFDSKKDQLWFVGDLVARGENSLATLQFVKELPNTIVVLGNHDLHLLALPFHPEKAKKSSIFEEISQAKDSEELLFWLRHQSLLHHDTKLNYTMVHAGLPMQWDLKLAQKCAKEVETILQDEKEYPELLRNMYSNKPDLWHDDLSGMERYRFIINAFTRMRFCALDGRLNLTCKSKIGDEPYGYVPWFKLPKRKNKNLRIVFGHWAALEAKCDEPNVFPLDSGCVWGRALTAMCLETGERFSVSCDKS